MNTITLLRSKGLTDDEILDALNRQASAQIQYAYKAGLRDGVKTMFRAFNQFATESNEELSA